MLQSQVIISKLEEYIKQNPSIAVIDPIPNVQVLLDRYKSYSIIRSTNLDKHDIFTPNFCVFDTNDVDRMKQQLINSKVTYPFICKPILGHGSRQAHKMCIIFNEKHLIDCKIPCVAQSFINHNAILYKIFIVGEKFCYVKRPSLKNFYANRNETIETIHFDSSDVSKADSQSSLSILDPSDVIENEIELDNGILDIIVSSIRQAFGMDLLGVDVVIENSTGKYAIIDINVCPGIYMKFFPIFLSKKYLLCNFSSGYDGFPNFFEALLDLVSKKVSSL